MSEENIDIVRRGVEHFRATGDLLDGILGEDFVWDMSTFRAWPEQQLYEGPQGARQFLSDWSEAFEDWEIHAESFHDAGDRVVVVMRQHGRSKGTGVPVDMVLAQVFTIRGGLQTRMEMYADPDEALKAVGLAE